MWSNTSLRLTFSIDGELLGIAVDVADSVGLDPDVSLHQRVFLEQVLHAQQMFPVILREQQHLQAQAHG